MDNSFYAHLSPNEQFDVLRKAILMTMNEDNTPIIITCSSTGNSFTVYSMAEAGRFFGVTAAAIHWQINNKKTKTPYKGYYLSYANKTLVLQEVIPE